jgi:hypothetical protein
MKEKLKDVLALLAEIGGLIIIFALFLFILNYFNLVSLWRIYPKQLGFLPHIAETSSNSNIAPKNKAANSVTFLNKKISGPNQFTTVGVFKLIRINEIYITPVGNSNGPTRFGIDSNSVFKETSLAKNTTTKVVSFDEFKQIMINPKDFTIKITYISKGSENIATEVIFFN